MNWRACWVKSSLICCAAEVCWVKAMDLNTTPMITVITAITTIISIREKPVSNVLRRAEPRDLNVLGTMASLLDHVSVPTEINPHICGEGKRESHRASALRLGAYRHQKSATDGLHIPAHVVDAANGARAIDIVHLRPRRSCRGKVNLGSQEWRAGAIRRGARRRINHPG